MPTLTVYPFYSLKGAAYPQARNHLVLLHLIQGDMAVTGNVL